VSGSAPVVALLVLLGVAACTSMQAAAARDPMHCERDPACSKARGAYPDCSRQCVDDPECVDRCRQVQEGTDSLGHPQ
jgi:hypothetical protein